MLPIADPAQQPALRRVARSRSRSTTSTRRRLRQAARAGTCGFIAALHAGVRAGQLAVRFRDLLALLHLFGAGEALFQTGWFVESLATQVLVIFVIRTKRPLFRSARHPLLAGMACGVVALALLLPFTAPGRWFGFVPLPGMFFVYLLVAVLAYLVLVEGTKCAFYRGKDI